MLLALGIIVAYFLLGTAFIGGVYLLSKLWGRITNGRDESTEAR